MDLWSKGLGRLVLALRLSERADMDVEEGELVMRGTMGEPTYWDWAVNLDEADVVEFILFLRRRESIRFMVSDRLGRRMLVRAVRGAVIFGLRTAGLILFGAGRARSPAPHARPTAETGRSPAVAASGLREEES